MYESSALIRDACYCVDQSLDLTVDEIDKILSKSENISLAVWLGLTAITLVKHHITPNNAHLTTVVMYVKKLTCNGR